MVTVTITPQRKKSFFQNKKQSSIVFIAALVTASWWYALVESQFLRPAPSANLEDTGTGTGLRTISIHNNNNNNDKDDEKKEEKDRPSSSSSSSSLVSTVPGITNRESIGTSDSGMPRKTNDSSSSSQAIYPLRSLNLPSAQEAYERGFWARAVPVPLDRWQAAANTTCIPHTNNTTTTGNNNSGSDGGDGDGGDWRRRVPHVIMIGAQKAGTTALSYYLYNHPSVQYLPSKELAYFDEELDQNPTILVNGSSSGIDATKVLDYYRQTVIGGIVPLQTLELGDKYVLDATPNYMLLSDRVPHRIFCAAPWVKLLASLRNPVDRAYSQYHMQLHQHMTHPELRRGFVSFEDYIALDMKVLQDTGVLPQGYAGWNLQEGEPTPTPPPPPPPPSPPLPTSQADDHVVASTGPPTSPIIDAAYFTSEKVSQGWATYTKLGLNSPVGRGIYVLQLLDWFQTMDLYEKPRSDLKVVSSDRLLHFPNETYTEILDFLELKPHSLALYKKIHATQYRVPSMAPEIRAKLQAFYQPFNRLLRDVLNDKEWEGIWETE